MSEESTAPDVVELTRRQLDAVNRRDMEAVMSLVSPDGVYDISPGGLGVFEGPVAIRGFITEWWGAFDPDTFEPEEVLDFGRGVVFAVVRQDARPAGSAYHVRQREAYVLEWVGGMIRRATVYADIDEARAAAARLAEERQ
jgi:ketosteroid isomerase-like protein